MPLRLLMVFLAGVGLGALVNWAAYRLAWNQRLISPWSPASPGLPLRRAVDRIPIVGWWCRRRETTVHGAGFWIRPLLVEVSMAAGLTGLCAFELHNGLLPFGALAPGPAVLQAQFLGHALLIPFMAAATLIDLDEQTIPDEVTVTGTLVGWVLAVVRPQSRLPVWLPSDPPVRVESLHLTSPSEWPTWLDGGMGLAIGLACVACWWYALLPKTLWHRGGVTKMLRYLVASIRRHPHSPRITGCGLLVAVGVGFTWSLGGERWQALLSALVGTVVAGALVWIVRVVATQVLHQEAMGFGDVTLMGMIGAFLGWQASILVFFLAPFTGAVIAIIQWLLTRRKDIAYGPFLCLAALAVIVAWPSVWENWGLPVCSLGGWLAALLGVCLLLLAALLGLVRGVLSRL